MSKGGVEAGDHLQQTHETVPIYTALLQPCASCVHSCVPNDSWKEGGGGGGGRGYPAAEAAASGPSLGLSVGGIHLLQPLLLPLSCNLALPGPVHILLPPPPQLLLHIQI